MEVETRENGDEEGEAVIGNGEEEDGQAGDGDSVVDDISGRI